MPGYAVNSTADYFTVFDEVSKLNVHLSYPERLWVVRPPLPSHIRTVADSV